MQFVLLSTQGTSWLQVLRPLDLHFSQVLEVRNLASSSSRHLGSAASETIFGMNMSPKSFEMMWKLKVWKASDWSSAEAEWVEVVTEAWHFPSGFLLLIFPPFNALGQGLHVFEKGLVAERWQKGVGEEWPVV